MTWGRPQRRGCDLGDQVCPSDDPCCVVMTALVTTPTTAGPAPRDPAVSDTAGRRAKGAGPGLWDEGAFGTVWAKS